MRDQRASNAALAEALFGLAERELEEERRLVLLRAGYDVFDASRPAAGRLVRQAQPWLRSIVTQLNHCRSEDALDAAVQRLAAGGRAPRYRCRDRFLARSQVTEVLAQGPPALLPQRMRGAFHWHTDASDGKASLEQMARACQRRGASWAVVCDHSKSLEVASGLDPAGVVLQRKRLDRHNTRAGEELRLFQGLEVEVLEDGSLDLTVEERSQVDCVVVAVHRQLEPDRDQTERLLRAISSPRVHVLAHPRGRLFLHRAGIKARWEQVFEACAAAQVAVEINGFPRRQDLDWELARLAGEAGCWIALASDAHAVRHLEYDAYACAIAMRARIDRKQILNVLHPEEFELWLEG